MLAVVEPQAVAAERPGRAAEAGLALEQRHLGALVDERQRGAQPGKPAADDDNLALHGAPREMARAATTTFSRVGSETRRSRTAVGSRSMRSSSRR